MLHGQLRIHQPLGHAKNCQDQVVVRVCAGLHCAQELHIRRPRTAAFERNSTRSRPRVTICSDRVRTLRFVACGCAPAAKVPLPTLLHATPGRPAVANHFPKPAPPRCCQRSPSRRRRVAACLASGCARARARATPASARKMPTL